MDTPVPVTAAEIQDWILNWMSQKLSMSKNRIDPEESMAAYGVDSLMVAEFEAEVSEYLGFHWPVMDMMVKDPSIRELSRRGAELAARQDP